MLVKYSEELIEEVRSRNDIVDVIAGYITLKKSGTSYKAKCPFHTEKTPSFSVSPDKQIFHCFGCGVGGNVITFIMKIENLNFVDALKLLADRVGMILPEKDQDIDKKKYRKRKIQYNIHIDAARYFYRNLKNSEVALRYLKERKITFETIVKFGLGYATNHWDGLYKYLLSKNYSKEDIAQSGLIIFKQNQSEKYYDRFRGRLIFPVFDLSNRVIAFGGRILDNQMQPKYLNSPETLIFSKGYHLYGLNHAKNNMKNRQIIIVEGYMDVISLYQYGIQNVVASLGTALTKEQARLLSRYAEEVLIAYDGDEAGQKATLRALDILFSAGCKAKVIRIPNQMDPDEYIRKYKQEGFIYLINQALSFIEYKVMLARSKYSIDTIEGKINFTKEVAQILKNIKSEIEIDAYIKKISRETGIDEAAIKSEVYHNKKSKIETSKNIIGNNRNTIQYKKDKSFVKNSVEKKSAIILAEENLIYMISQDFRLFQIFKQNMKWEDFTDDFHRKIAKIIFEKMENKEYVIPAELLDIFKTEEAGEKIASIFSKELNKEFMEKDIMEYINTIQVYTLQNKIDQLNQNLKKMSKKENPEAINKVYIEIVKLKKKLEELKGN
ncbi:DNA primase [Garciella nitratireducens]|uniref:DNA primase n=1 Tax=Garciella nitratireducens DSM 15102 TaxID=1121911 RepID=A0A1T4JS17_9FIRM|nr:DNA primase [Garciella nitratireducens]SJZ32933.1 DNA primase [Garciella nitratireducens DSM 15102]